MTVEKQKPKETDLVTEGEMIDEEKGKRVEEEQEDDDDSLWIKGSIRIEYVTSKILQMEKRKNIGARLVERLVSMVRKKILFFISLHITFVN